MIKSSVIILCKGQKNIYVAPDFNELFQSSVCPAATTAIHLNPSQFLLKHTRQKPVDSWSVVKTSSEFDRPQRKTATECVDCLAISALLSRGGVYLYGSVARWVRLSPLFYFFMDT